MIYLKILTNYAVIYYVIINQGQGRMHVRKIFLFLVLALDLTIRP